MKFHLLYRFLLAGVLLFAGCSREETQDPAPITRETPRETPSEPVPPSKDPVILFLGNSLSAGYGLRPDQSFPALIQQRIDSLGLPYRVVNAGLSGDTSAGGVRRIDWLLQQRVDILVLELGGNDGLRGIPPEVTKENLAEIIDKTRAVNPDVEILLAGMQMPPNLGRDYTERFRAIFPDLAEEKDVILIPFLLEGVGGVRQLNQPDGIHPTAAGQRILAENVWDVLYPVLQQKS